MKGVWFMVSGIRVKVRAYGLWCTGFRVRGLPQNASPAPLVSTSLSHLVTAYSTGPCGHRFGVSGRAHPRLTYEGSTGTRYQLLNNRELLSTALDCYGRVGRTFSSTTMVPVEPCVNTTMRGRLPWGRGQGSGGYGPGFAGHG